MPDVLLQSAFSTPAMAAATADEAWLQGMLDFEAGLARAQARVGLIPEKVDAAIVSRCGADYFDVAAIAGQTIAGGNPAIPLVAELTRQVPGQASRYVHWGATSQGVIDTATMRVLRRALPIIIDDLKTIEAACARLADAHRDTLMAGRTLLQQGPPITFGPKAAGWLVPVRRARRDLQTLCDTELAVQFGGAVGTLAPLGDDGEAVLSALAEALDLAEPTLPWHGTRERLLRVGSALAVAASALGKIAGDVVLLMQTEVGEVSEPDAGGSSAMPHKRNPVASTLTLAAVRRVHGLASELFSASIHEHERAAGAWHAEWQPIFDCLRLTGAAAHHMRAMTAGLSVNNDRMQHNLQMTQGVTMAEAAKTLLTPYMDRNDAHRLVGEACEQALAEGRPLADVLAGNEAVTAQISVETLRDALEPAHYIGSAVRFIDRALADKQGRR